MTKINILWILFSYLLGSIPFGYIITKLSTKKNVLEVGWKKTSGSNVYKNIGKWQGVLTGLLDLGKGFMAVKLGQILNMSDLTLALSGVAAVTGHNWSCFLRFAGGRGIGTFVGAALALSPKLLGLSIFFPLVLALIWNASIATILFLATIIVLAYKYNQSETMGLFAVISLFPIFIKRLSPISDLLNKHQKTPKNRIVLMRNRLIFDDDITYLEPRIVKLIKKLSWW